MTWLGVYSAFTSGVRVGDNATVIFDFENEAQPDGLLRLEPECGGRSHLTENHYIEGPPELVIEVAASSAAYDLHTKRRMYQRQGIQEYIAVQIYEQRIDWFRLRDGVYQSLVADATGVLSSEIFPGLCLDEKAFWAGRMDQVLGLLQERLASPEHTAFVTDLNARIASTPPPPNA
jgi:Uma2 family endonuclease